MFNDAPSWCYSLIIETDMCFYFWYDKIPDLYISLHF